MLKTDRGLLDYNSLQPGTWLPTFWRILLLEDEDSRILQNAECVVPTYQATWCHKQEDQNLRKVIPVPVTL